MIQRYFFEIYIYVKTKININFNVCVKRIYPHKTNNNILFATKKSEKSIFRPVCDDRIRHLNHMRH